MLIHANANISNSHLQHWGSRIGRGHLMSSLGASLPQIQWHADHCGGQILTSQYRGYHFRRQKKIQTSLLYIILCTFVLLGMSRLGYATTNIIQSTILENEKESRRCQDFAGESSRAHRGSPLLILGVSDCGISRNPRGTSQRSLNFPLPLSPSAGSLIKIDKG